MSWGGKPPGPRYCRNCDQPVTAGRLRDHGQHCMQCYVPPRPQPRSRFGYHHPIRRAARRVLRLKACACGCNIIYAAGVARDWGDLTRLQKWATFDPDEES